MVGHRYFFARAYVIALAVSLVATFASPASAAITPDACPEITILDQSEVEALVPGTPLIGLTVEQGDTPSEIGFVVEHVQKGALQDGAPLIVARATSGTPVTEDKGIWFGMSGSPVYTVDINGDPDALVGAVAFGLAWDGTSTVAGLQPAYQMEAVRSYPATAAPTSSVTLSSTGAAKVAASTGMAPSTVQRFEPLALPLTMSGSSKRIELIQRAADHAGLRLIPMANGAATTAALEPATVAAGDTFAAALSYGYLTAAAIGTTTYACGDHAMAFGHPFFFTGRTHMGANAGTDAYVVADSIGGSYKMAEVGGLAGRLDQDRAAGIRAALGEDVPLLPIITTVSAPDIGQSSTERTDLVESDEGTFLAWDHTLQHLDATADMISKGSSYLRWTINGVTQRGTPFQLVRANRYTSEWDITFETTFDMFDDLMTLQNNPFTEVRFTSLEAEGKVFETVKELRVTRIKVLRDGVWRSFDTLRVSPGEELQLRIVLATGDGTKIVERRLTVPRRARGSGVLVASGRGGNEFDEEGAEEFVVECSFDECESESQGPSTFQELLDAMALQPRNDTLTTRLVISDYNEETGEERVWRRTSHLRQYRVVTGSVRIPVRVRR